MYCPQCGTVNDDSIRFCTKCGFNLEEHRRQWSDPAAGSAAAAAAQVSTTGQPPVAGTVPGSEPVPTPDGQPAGQASPQPGTYPPPYPQQYQAPYQGPPPYQPAYYQPAPAYGTIPKIPSYLGWAIATLILCFWPTGIVAVVFASRVGNKLALGDVPGAQEASRKAKMWCWITFGIAIAIWVISIAIMALAAAAVINTSVTVY